MSAAGRHPGCRKCHWQAAQAVGLRPVDCLLLASYKEVRQTHRIVQLPNLIYRDITANVDIAKEVDARVLCYARELVGDVLQKIRKMQAQHCQ
jgi:hypothetical protein